MPSYTLPPRPEVEQMIGTTNQDLDKVLVRATELLQKAGYVIGPGSVQRGVFGGFIVDTDRDPTTDYMNWNPTAKSDKEKADDTTKTEFDAVTTRLEQGITLRKSGAQFNAAQRAELDIATMEALIKLRKSGTV